jgi:hypothetical protein
VDFHEIIPCALGVIGSPFLAVAPFSRRYRQAPRWLRSGFLLAAPLVLAWALLGLYLALHETNHHTHLSPATFWFVHCMHLTAGGMGLGILVTLVISPEFYRRHDRGGLRLVNR